MQEALLRRQQRALAVDEERAALEDERRPVPADAEVRGQQLREPRVLVVRQVLLPPRVEAEVDERDLAAVVPHEDRAVVAEPRVVDRQLERFHARAAAAPNVAQPHPRLHTITTGSNAATARAVAAHSSRAASR